MRQNRRVRRETLRKALNSTEISAEQTLWIGYVLGNQMAKDAGNAEAIEARLEQGQEVSREDLECYNKAKSQLDSFGKFVARGGFDNLPQGDGGNGWLDFAFNAFSNLPQGIWMKFGKLGKPVLGFLEKSSGGRKVLRLLGAEGAALNKLPNLENATISLNKIKGYALDSNHPVGAHKAKVFEHVLGYNQSNADHLMLQIKQKLMTSEAVLGIKDKYGQRFTVDMQITGANGNTAVVRTGWIIDVGSDIPRLTTIFVK